MALAQSKMMCIFTGFFKKWLIRIRYLTLFLRSLLRLIEFQSNFDFRQVSFNFSIILFTRFDMSKPEKHYSEKPMARTLEEIRKCALNQSYSCVHQHLLNVPLGDIVLDELHLMLRITGTT